MRLQYTRKYVHRDKDNDNKSQNAYKYIIYNLCNPFLVNVIAERCPISHRVVTKKADFEIELLDSYIGRS